jgi:hypothetical protein
LQQVVEAEVDRLVRQARVLLLQAVEALVQQGL